jgi:hypothetical protein
MLMRGVGMIRRIETVLLLLLLVAGLSIAAPALPNVNMNPGQSYLEHTNDFQQDVSGEGYAMVYQNVNTNNLSVKNYMHGSGVIDMATLIHSQQKPYTDIEYVSSGGVPVDIYSWDSTINFTEQNQMTYAPEGFVYGNGWYAAHPIEYKSLLKEKTDGRNWQAGISMDHQIEYARAFKKDVAVQLNCTGGAIGIKGEGLGKMKIEEDVTQGTVHIGELLTNPQIPGSVAALSAGIPKVTSNGQMSRIEPQIEIDENYVGNFKIQKLMEINVPKSSYSNTADWLPCCMGGFFDMYTWDQNVNSAKKGIFDCTCEKTALSTYKPTWDGTAAQFPK